MTEELKAILAANERYSDFKILDTPVPFAEWAKDKKYFAVQVHDTTVYKWDDGADILGFVGVFEWKDNALTPLDGDTYNELMPVIGYEEDEDTLDILVEGGSGNGSVQNKVKLGLHPRALPPLQSERP